MTEHFVSETSYYGYRQMTNFVIHLPNIEPSIIPKPSTLLSTIFMQAPTTKCKTKCKMLKYIILYLIYIKFLIIFIR